MPTSGEGTTRPAIWRMASAICLFVMGMVAVLNDSVSNFGSENIRRLQVTNQATNHLAETGCKRLGLPQPMEKIPLSSKAYDMDRGKTANFVMGILDKDVEPPIHLALPRIISERIHKGTGKFLGAGNSENTWNRAKSSKAEDGIFIDVGGYVGDSSFPSAALGMDTYVFEPVRYNTNMMHFSLLANHCQISEHLTIVNALVGERNSAKESVYVSYRTDNSASKKAQATKNVGAQSMDYEQPTEMVTLDSFFPSGTRVQNLKIDVQGNELHVLRGAERILKENKGRLKIRFEYDETLLRSAGTNPEDLLQFMENLGYQVKSRGADIDME